MDGTINKKVKSTYPVTLSEVKTHLRIDSSTLDDDTYLSNYIIKSATKMCENFIDKDIALTANTLKVWDFNDNWLRVNEGNLVAIQNIITDSSTLINSNNYTLEIYGDHFEVEFNATVSDNPLTLQFTTGYDGSTVFCPEEIKQAIFIQSGNLYDMERNSYSSGNIKKNDIVNMILGPYKAIRW